MILERKNNILDNGDNIYDEDAKGDNGGVEDTARENCRPLP